MLHHAVGRGAVGQSGATERGCCMTFPLLKHSFRLVQDAGPGACAPSSVRAVLAVRCLCGIAWGKENHSDVLKHPAWLGVVSLLRPPVPTPPSPAHAALWLSAAPSPPAEPEPGCVGALPVHREPRLTSDSSLPICNQLYMKPFCCIAGHFTLP